MNRKTLLYITFTLLCYFNLRAQYYNTGQDPASLKWLQIKSDHFFFIFPEGYEHEARRTALTFEAAYKHTGGRYEEAEIKRFPVIIHNHSSESNGYLAWAPKRVELYPFPGQNGIPLSHTEQLALHELIHVSQMQALRKGIARPLEYVLGEQYTGAVSIFTPFWFLEGDAVVSESIFTNSGRGRLPDFEKPLRAMLLDEDKDYNYDKLISGSYKDFTPNHYQFGYQMTAYARANFGDRIFSDALDNIARKPFTLNPFNHSMKRSAGVTKKSLYDTTIDYLRTNWSEQDKRLEKSQFTYHDNRDTHNYISYHSPKLIGKDSIIAIKASLTDPASFVLITDQGKSEKKLFTPGYVWPYRFSAAGSTITWAENVSDPRWDNRSYSIIKVYNIKTRVLSVLSNKSRLFSPVLSYDQKIIAASESSESYKNSLTIINRFSGNRIKTIDLPDNVMCVNPQWSTDNKKIVFIYLSDKGEGIMIYDTNNESFEVALQAGRSDLQSVALQNDTIYYVASYSGINNVYSIGPDKLYKQLTSSRFGVEDLSIKDGKLYFSDYSSGGNRIASFPASTVYNIIDPPADDPLLQIGSIDSSDKLTYSLDNMPNSYTIEPYRKWKHLFNIHSWMPFYADLNNLSFDNIGISPGATIMSQNHLSTLTSSIGYEYINNEHLLHSYLSWEGRYPALDLDLTYGGAPNIVQDSDSLYYPSSVNRALNISATAYLPLRFTTGRFRQTFYPSLRLTYRNDYIYEERAGVFDNGQVQATGRIYFANLHKMAHRDIWPRWGQIVDIFGTFSPGDKSIYGPIKTFRASIYTPGLIKNHGLKLMFQSENQDPGRFIQYNRISLPRGYMHLLSTDLKSYSADYAMPLAYPDFNLGSLLYLKRIRTGFFYDYSIGSGNYYLQERRFVEEEEAFSSFGVELLADFHLLRLPLDFSGGIQSAWLPGKKEPYFKLLFNIDVFGFVIGKDRHGPSY